MIKKVPMIIIILLFILTSFSCVLTSKNPLGSKKDAVLDKDLLGVWEIIDKEKGNKGYLIILEGNDKVIQFIAVEDYYKFSEPGYQGFITEINNQKYINLQSLNIIEGSHKTDINEEYIFVLYKIKNNTLEITSFNQDFFEEAVKKGELKGNIEKVTTTSTQPVLTDTTENIRKFIEKQKSNDYLNSDNKIILKRIKRVP